jgi:hypothetical protein
MAHAMRASIAWQNRDDALARSSLVKARDGFRRAEMRVFAATADNRLRTLGGESRRDELSADSERFLVSQGVRNLSRWTEMLIPGFAARTPAVGSP